MDAPIHATVGCAFASDDAAIAAMRALSAIGGAGTWRVGAVDAERSAKIVQAIPGSSRLDPADPLAGVAGLASGDDAATGVNNGAAIGAITGAVLGFAAGFTPLVAIMPVAPDARALASMLLFFAVGAALGGVLGGAFGRRPSTHAGFRLIDAMEAGDVALVVSVESSRLDEARHALENSGASEVIVIAAQAASA